MTLWRYDDEPLGIECHECLGAAYETTPGDGRFWCPSCEQWRTPNVTEHALHDRWSHLTSNEWGSTPECLIQAWKDGKPIVEDPRDWSDKDPSTVPNRKTIGHRFVGTQLRYHKPTVTGILLRNNNLVTVIDAKSARLNAKYAIAQTYLADTDDSEVFREIVDDIRLNPDTLDTVVERERLRRAFAAKYEQSTQTTVSASQEPGQQTAEQPGTA